MAALAQHPALVKGYIGPAVLGEESESGIRYLVDPRVVEGTRWVTGANSYDTHVIDLVAGRDFSPDGVIDVAEVREGDPSPDGSGPLSLARGIEMGHIFQLGRKYAEAMKLSSVSVHRALHTLEENVRCPLFVHKGRNLIAQPAAWTLL